MSENDIGRCSSTTVLGPSNAIGSDVVMEPFQNAADREVKLLCGAPEEERTEIAPIETEGKQT